METIHVVDAGVLFTDWMKRNPHSTFVTTSGVLGELRNRPSLQRAESMISIGKLAIMSVESSKMELVRSAAQDSGDIAVLSEIDLELIALAVQQMESGVDVVIVSSDLALLNTAKHLGLRILDPGDKMKHAIEWTQKCPACGRISIDPTEVDCVVCGTKMKRKVKTRSKI